MFITENEVNIIKDATEILTPICKLALPEEVCIGIFHLYSKITLDSANDKYANAEYVCSKMAFCEANHYVKANYTEYQNRILKDFKKPDPLPPPGKDTFKFLHISDIHVDLEYTPNSESDCGIPMCCRGQVDETVKIPAGYWGTRASCDVPL